MEIERKFLIKTLPADLDSYPCSEITQAYLCTNPVMRIRKQDETYVFTYKGKGLMVREEYNLPLNKEAFEQLLPKAEGCIISKTRYRIPLSGADAGLSKDIALLIELDLFKSPSDLIMAEVEFPDEESALSFTPPYWFDKDVTGDPAYHNSNMIYSHKD
ncbi:MAG: CYTH domain-containing protein [Lachnospiraceae bacterium]|nr:CYTH domain-containing protein [Lachnospiraceae bacterium]